LFFIKDYKRGNMRSKPLLILILLVLTGCSPAVDQTHTPLTTVETTTMLATDLPSLTPAEPSQTPESSPTPKPISFSLTSPAFGAGELIPVQFARKGDDLSPPLEWADPPEGTKSLALILFSDPVMDGGGNWVHWILYNIPPDSRALPQNIQPDMNGTLPDGSKHFKNSWGEQNYGGPNPPHVQTFKYYFILYALDTTLDLDAVEKRMDDEGTLPWIGSSKAVLEEAISNHVLGLGELTAAYKEIVE
jgi:Raf kinase inhibitor-like YbhB/YbcL family protein